MQTLRASVLLLVALALAVLTPAAAAQVHIVVAPGQVEGRSYVNKSIGVSYRFPEDWIGIAEPPDGSGPGMRLLKAAPRNAASDTRRLALDAIAQKHLPADQRRDPARFLAANDLAQRGALGETRPRKALRADASPS